MSPPVPESDPRHELLVRAAALLNAYGTPSHRVERVMTNVARRLGVTASFYSTPTSLMASIGSGANERVHLVRVEPGEVNLGKLVEFDEVLEDVEAGRATSSEGLARLEEAAARGPRYGVLAVALAFALASGGAARVFGGDGTEVLLSCVLGVGIFLLDLLLRRLPSADGTFEPLAAFLVAATSLVVACTVVPVDYRLVTLAALIVLLPGLTLTVAMTELATRHLVSGTARVARAGTVFLTLLLGVALAWRIGGSLWPEFPAHTRVALPDWTRWLALALTPLAFAILFETRRQEWWIVFLASWSGVLASTVGADALGADLGAFLGALAVGVVSNLYARRVNRPALVPMTPGILVLVPGSIGYRSLIAFLDQQAVAGIDGAFRTGLIATSLVGGLLAANLVVPPRRVL